MTMKEKFKPRLAVNFLSFVLLSVIIFAAGSTKAAADTKATTLQQTENTMFVNDHYTIPLSDKIKNATYIYTSNKTKIAKVNSKGVITGLDNGTASIKIRYKYDGEIHTVGTFKTTIKKTSLNDTYKSFDMLTGATLEPKQYLETPNPDAVYVISSSSVKVANGGSDGIIHATKAGRAAISIYEVYNDKTRPVGAIGVSVTGASFKKDAIKMAYGMSINNNDLLDDMDSGASYKWTSGNPSLVSTSNTKISSARSGSSTQTCDITVEETLPDKTQHVIGTLKVTVTNDTFVSSLDQEITIGFGEVITVGTKIIIHNRASGAQYKLIPADISVLLPEEVKNNPTKLEAIGYGTTDVIIEETKNGTTKTLEDTVNVTVSQAKILEELTRNGLQLSVNGSTYNSYPFEYRNLKATYSYTSANSSICSVGSNGKEDVLVAVGKKAGETKISVYETVTTITTNTAGATSTPVINNTRKKIGTFKVIVGNNANPSSSPAGSFIPSGSSSPAGSSSPSGSPAPSGAPVPSGAPAPSGAPVPSGGPAPTKKPVDPGNPNVDLDAYFDDPAANRLINSINFTHNGKTYTGYVSDSGLECIFGDEEYNPDGYIDYGTDFDKIVKDDFKINLKGGIDITDIESYGTEWTISIALHDEDDTVEDVTIILNEEELDTKSILSKITVKIPYAQKEITAATSDIYDDENHWFDNGNKEFKVYFTPKQYCKAEAHEFDDYIEEKDLPSDHKEPEKDEDGKDIKDEDGNIVYFINIPDGTLSDLPNGRVSCKIEPATGADRNTAVTSIPDMAESDDNQYWTFEVEFENGMTEEFSIELDVLLD